MPRKRDAQREALRNDPRLLEALELMRKLADAHCGPDASFHERSAAMRRVAAAVLPGVLEGDDDGHEREDPKR